MTTSEPRKHVVVGLALHDRLAAEARRRDVSVAKLVGWACERALDRWEAQDLDALLRTERRP